MNTLHTTADVIDRLGGNVAVAELLDTNPKAVSNWRIFGKFPSYTYIAIRAALKRRRCNAPDELWTWERRKSA